MLILEYTKVKDTIFEDAPICNVAACLYQDFVYCTSELHNITPNNPKKCKKVTYAKEI